MYVDMYTWVWMGVCGGQVTPLESVLSFYHEGSGILTQVLGKLEIWSRSPGLHSRCFYPLNHLSGPFVCILNQNCPWWISWGNEVYLRHVESGLNIEWQRMGWCLRGRPAMGHVRPWFSHGCGFFFPFCQFLGLLTAQCTHPNSFLHGVTTVTCPKSSPRMLFSVAVVLAEHFWGNLTPAEP